ncbi:hypothetical protein [Paraburkholderia sacchari]|uniref:Uncharacterized protein n=1 Tax=Paraburkholderia sacchari TaxID=159450 RepID=A0A8T6ZGE0_9BURK|nr:hypothetical protein [Paraburkholderia sacchari]NLP63652.1 hypothetical protein [Paraburkholderia sacchari]
MQQAILDRPHAPAVNVWRGTLSGASASLIGIVPLALAVDVVATARAR